MLQLPGITPQRFDSLALPPRAIVVSGTLGSGKTTLLNHLLSTTTEASRPGSYVVIENDIGSTNTDTARLRAAPESILAITAGCICCNDLHSLRAAISQLRDQTHIRSLFIETTGIAEPRAVKELLHSFNIPTLLIVTVDAKHFDENQRLGRTAETIPYADLLALTWTHNQDGERDEALVEKVSATLSSLNPTARKVEISPSGEPLTELSLDACQPIAQLPSQRSGLFSSILLGNTPRPSDSHAHSHREFTITLDLSRNLTPSGVISAINGSLSTPLLRAKGHLNGVELDCTLGDWKVTPSDRTIRRNYLTLIAREPLRADSFPTLVEPSPAGGAAIDLNDPTVRGSAIRLVQHLMATIPQEVVVGGRLITETDAGEAWRYVSLSGFPEDLKEQFLKALCDLYLKQHEAIQTGKFDSHPTLPYYQREVGYNLSWLLIDCRDLLQKWGVEQRIASLHPVSLYFTGLASARDARHIGTFKSDDEPYLKQRLLMIQRERGSEGLLLAQAAITNCRKLCVDGSWSRAAEVLATRG